MSALWIEVCVSLTAYVKTDRVDMCVCATMVSDCLKTNTAVKVRVGLVCLIT